MKEITALDLHFMEKELKVIEGGHLDKMYQWPEGEFVFKINTKNGKKNLRIKIPGLIFLSEKPFTAPTKILGFCQYLRKHLLNARIHSVEQKDFERIIQLKLTKGQGEFLLIIELFKPGNIVLCDTEMNILNCFERQIYKDREIKPKIKYQYPPVQFNIKTGEIVEAIKNSNKILSKALAIDLVLSGKYSDEITTRSKIDKNKETKDLNEKEIKELQNQINFLLNQKIKPFISGKEAYPIEMQTKIPEKECSSFSEAVEYFQEVLVAKKEEVSVEHIKEISILESQKKRLRSLEKEHAEEQKKGEYIYEHYSEFETLLRKVNELKKTKSFKEIKELLKENKHFKDLNEKEKKIILEF